MDEKCYYEQVEFAKRHYYVELDKEYQEILTENMVIIRHLITLAAVMLSLSFPLVERLRQAVPVCHPWLLQGCLGFLAATVLSGVIASCAKLQLHIRKKKIFAEQIAKIQGCKDQVRPDLLHQIQQTPIGITNPKIFFVAFCVEIASFFLATLFLAAFGIANI